METQQSRSLRTEHAPPLLSMRFLTDLWAFLRHRKKLWLVPIVTIMFIFGVLVVLAEGSAITPFIYTLF